MLDLPHPLQSQSRRSRQDRPGVGLTAFLSFHPTVFMIIIRMN